MSKCFCNCALFLLWLSILLFPSWLSLWGTLAYRCVASRDSTLLGEEWDHQYGAYRCSSGEGGGSAPRWGPATKPQKEQRGSFQAETRLRKEAGKDIGQDSCKALAQCREGSPGPNGTYASMTGRRQNHRKDSSIGLWEHVRQVGNGEWGLSLINTQKAVDSPQHCQERGGTDWWPIDYLVVRQHMPGHTMQFVFACLSLHTWAMNNERECCCFMMNIYKNQFIIIPKREMRTKS